MSKPPDIYADGHKVFLRNGPLLATMASDHELVEKYKALFVAAPDLLDSCEAMIDRHRSFHIEVEPDVFMWCCPFCTAYYAHHPTKADFVHDSDCPLVASRLLIATLKGTKL